MLSLADVEDRWCYMTANSFIDIYFIYTCIYIYTQYTCICLCKLSLFYKPNYNFNNSMIFLREI